MLARYQMTASCNWFPELLKLSPSAPHPSADGVSAPSNSTNSANKRRHRDSLLPAFISSCLETLRSFFVKLGHSWHTAEFMTVFYHPYNSCTSLTGATSWKSPECWIFIIRNRHFSWCLMELFDRGVCPLYSLIGCPLLLCCTIGSKSRLLICTSAFCSAVLLTG